MLVIFCWFHYEHKFLLHDNFNITFTFLVLCCALLYDFRIEKLFGSSLPPLVCRRAHVLFMLFVFVAYSGVQYVATVYMSNMTDIL